MIARLLKEPLAHFLVLALAIFALYGALNRTDAPPTDEIVVTGAKIEQLAGLFAKTWQRPPTASEVKVLIDDHVKEEILYREALALGLDKDDTVIRRRLRLKMEFLSQAQAESTTPSEAELEAFLKSNPDRFQIDPTLAFRQVLLSPERRGETIEQDVASVLEVLRAKPDTDPATLGDPTILPAELPPTRKVSVRSDLWRGLRGSRGPDAARCMGRADQVELRAPCRSCRRKQARAGRQASQRSATASRRNGRTSDGGKTEEAQFVERLKRYPVRIETQIGNAGPTGRSP